MRDVGVGLSLQPDEQYVELLEPLLRERVDYYEVAPETLWRIDDRDGELLPNGYFERFAALAEETGCPLVAHGVGLSLGSASDRDAERRACWLRRVALDHRRLRFAWYTDHLGASALDGLAMTLPLPLPMTEQALAVVRSRLREMQAIVPQVGVENNVPYFLFGDPLEEPGFLREAVDIPGGHLLLDLHNLYTFCDNFDVDPEAYLARLDLDRAIELHISGGRDSDPDWLSGGQTMRLDSHDAPVPEPVWALLERVLPRCPQLRGVTLERMEGTVEADDVALIDDELARLRSALAALR